jgi:hypothetical protein
MRHRTALRDRNPGRSLRRRLRQGASFGAGFALAVATGWCIFPIVLYEEEVQPLQFSHALHAGDVGQTCQGCHFDAAGVFTGIPSIETCAVCHSEQLGITEDEKRLVGTYVKSQREIPWLVYARQPDAVYFPHVRHVQLAQLPCERCHGTHGSSERLRPLTRNRLNGYSRDVWGSNIAGIARADWDGMKMGDCSGCHRRRQVIESCLDCHR